MANRSFQDMRYALVKREVTLYAAVQLSSSGTVIALQKWNYPALGQGAIARTYSPANVGAALTPQSGAPWPLQYNAGSEGVRSIVRTNVGLWTVTLQDNYQRVLMVNFLVQTALTAAGTQAQTVSLDGTVLNMGANGGSVLGVRFMSNSTTVAEPSVGNDLVLLKMDLADGTEP
jgi:hypothetical protein